LAKPLRGVVLTEQEYKRVELTYIKAASAFVINNGITALKVD